MREATDMKKFIITMVSILALIVLIVILNMFYVVDEDEHALVVRFSKVIEVKSEAGIYVKTPFVDKVITYPRSAQLYDINPSPVYLKDKTAMIADSFVVWKITDPLLFHTKVSGSMYEAQNRLDTIAYNNIKTKFGNLSQHDVVNTDDPAERNKIYNEILSLVKEAALPYGIEVLDLKIKRFDLPESNENEVYNRMISERNQMAQLYKSQGETAAALITNAADKDYNTRISDANLTAEQILAEGEAEYMRILASAYDSAEKAEFYAFIRALEALKASMTGDKVIILGADSEIAKILNNN